MTGHLVYVRAPRGPVAEKWPADSPNWRRLDAKQIMAKHELDAVEYGWPLSALISHYPAPKEAP